MKKKREIDFKYNLKIYWSFLKNYKSLLIGILLLSVVSAIATTAPKFLYKIVIDNSEKFSSGVLAKSEFIELLTFVAITYIIIRVILSISKWFHIHLINKIDSKMMKDIKTRFFDHIIHLSYNFHTSKKTGSLISRIIRGGSAIESMNDIIAFHFAPLLFQTIVVGTVLIYFSWTSALTIFVTMIAFILSSLKLQNLQKKANMAVIDASDVEKANLSDFMTNIDSIKHFGKENKIKRKFKSFTSITKHAMVKHWDYFRWLEAIQSLILSIGFIFLMYFPLTQFVNGEISIGTVIFVYAVYGDIVGPLFGFMNGIRRFYRSMADFQPLFEYGKMENEIKDKPGAKKLKIKKGTVEFKKVSFNYHEGQKLLKKFTLKINENEKVAFVGHSGSGKSTLVKLLYRLYDLDKGEILIDDISIKEVQQESLRSELSIVPQECILFDDTIYNNIAFSNPGATKEEVISAMKFAQLYRIVKTFPKKEKTIVGERGVKLSGGEKQRVSIARAILANKKLLVLDEATSALDSQTEHDIQRDLEKLMIGRTSIIIAHRLSTIMNSDKIVVLDKGKIVQIGTHKELIKIPGRYRKLWNLQKGGYIK
ncbi:ABC transporter ATP-binding protein [archaeon]|nr:ABC transporter ATP-binding protein [archaeon]